MKSKLILSLMLLTLFFSCKKSGSLKITITDLTTGNPADYMNIHVDEILKEANSNEKAQLKKIYWGEDRKGIIYLSEKLNKHHKYLITLMLPYPSYCYYNKNIDTIQFGDTEWENGVDFNLAKWSNFTLFFKNLNCQGPSDSIIVDFHPDYLPDYNKLKYTLIGCSNPNKIVDIPSGKCIGNWTVIKNGVTTYHDTVLYLNSFENIQINY